MIPRFVSVVLTTVLTFSPILSTSAGALAQGQSQGTLTFGSAPSFPLQGEIAYVLEGDVILHDLSIGSTRQVTDDGQAMYPAWSPDGRWLLYSSGPDIEQADLYRLDIRTANAQPELVAEDACCGGWLPDNSAIAFVDLFADNRQLYTVNPDGGDVFVLPATLDIGLNVHPRGNLQIFEFEDVTTALIPVEYMPDPSEQGENSLEPKWDVLQVDLGTGEIENLTPSTFDIATTGFSGLITADGPLAFIAIECPPEANSTLEYCSSGSTQPATGFSHFVSNFDGVALPGLGHPSLSPSGDFIAAERYLPANTTYPEPADAQRWGVAVARISDGQVMDIASGASQPAWRPAPPTDPFAQRLAQPNEFVVTLEPPLAMNEHLYRVSYLTTGDLRNHSAQVLTLFSSQYFTQQEITGLVVSEDGEREVTDPDLLRRIFALYVAGYRLYERPAFTDYPTYESELDKVLNNPIFIALAPGEYLSINADEFIGSRRTQTAEALRLLLADGLATKTSDDLIARAFEEEPTTIEEFATIVDGLVEKEYAYREALQTLSNDFSTTMIRLDTAVAGLETSLFLYQLMGRMVFLPSLAAERAEWLSAYVADHPSATGALDADQTRAAAQVIDEVESANQQRVDIAVEMGTELIEKGLLRAAERLGVDAAAGIVAYISRNIGIGIATHTAASALSAASIGLTAGNLLYGGSGLVAHFKLAERSEELRFTFAAGRSAVEAAAQEAWQREEVYQASTIERYRSALLLESLAAIQTQREYAEGVAATYALPNPVSLFNWATGQDWRTVVEGLQADADSWEAELITEIANPAFIESAVTLLQTRTPDNGALPGAAPLVCYEQVCVPYLVDLTPVMRAVPQPESSVADTDWYNTPEYLAFTFPENIDPEQWIEPSLSFYPVANYGETNPTVGDMLTTLQDLLSREPELVPLPDFPRHLSEDIPLPFALGTGLRLATQPRYIKLQGGSGMRAVIQVGQDILPAIGVNLLYVFVGFSDDGTTYIQTVFPINATLADAPPQELPQTDAEYAALEAYDDAAAVELGQMSPADFAPSLDLLDQLVEGMILGVLSQPSDASTAAHPAHERALEQLESWAIENGEPFRDLAATVIRQDAEEATVFVMGWFRSEREAPWEVRASAITCYANDNWACDADIPLAWTLAQEPPTSPRHPGVEYVLAESRNVGDYQIELWQTDFEATDMGPDMILRVMQGGNRVLEMEAPTEDYNSVIYLDELTGTDITGEGNPDLLFRTHSGGMHCCIATYLYDMGEYLRELHISGPNDSMAAGYFEDLDGDGIYEIISVDGIWIYSEWCSYADSPFVPIVLSYRDGSGYEAANLLFPEQYEEAIALALEEVESGWRTSYDGTNKCDVLNVVLLFLYSGQTDSGWAAFDHYYRELDASEFRLKIEEVLSYTSYYVPGR